MAEFRLSIEAETELDGIWLRIARESDRIDMAARVVNDITDRFWLLAQYPYIGRRRDDDLAPAMIASASTSRCGTPRLDEKTGRT